MKPTIDLASDWDWPQFVDGHRLTAGALTSLSARLREMRWLHNRALHDWGVARGCTVRITDDQRWVVVSAGDALDVYGRELRIASEVRLAAPSSATGCGPTQAEPWWVTLDYTEESDASVSAEGCSGCQAPERVVPRGRVRWRSPRDHEPGQRLVPGVDVILAEVWIERGLAIRLTTAGRRDAVPGPRPNIRAGTCNYDQKSWELWPSSDSPAVVKVKVDTKDAKFLSVPQYFPQVNQPETIAGNTTKSGTLQIDEIVAGPAYVVDPAIESFTLIIPIQVEPTPPPAGVKKPPNKGGKMTGEAAPSEIAGKSKRPPTPQEIMAVIKSWAVSWMGVET